jgi:hypothetical protein
MPMDQLIGLREPPTAVYAYSDEIAHGRPPSSRGSLTRPPWR